MPVDALLELHPPVAHAWWWWLVVAFLAVAALGLAAGGVWRWWDLTHGGEPFADDALQQLREDALRRIDELSGAPLPGHERALGIGRVARAFVGTVGDGDADYQSADQLRIEALKDPSLGPVAELAARIEAYAFGGAEDDPAALAVAAKDVVSTWH